MHHSTRKALAAFAILIFGAGAFAHDFWIRPSLFRADKDARLGIDLRVGERLIGDAVVRNSDKIARFVAVHASGREEAIVGLDGSAPAGLLLASEPGLLWIGYESKITAIELAAEKFEAYLTAEGLEHVSAVRRERGESTKPAKEIYMRTVKSLITVGAAEHKGFDRKLGLPLELVPTTDPTAVEPGGELPLILHFQGQPLAGALVGCMREGDADGEVRLRTDEKGRVNFKLAERGVHLVRVVHMLPAPPDSNAQWKSFWSSLTFERAPPAPAGKAAR